MRGLSVGNPPKMDWAGKVIPAYARLIPVIRPTTNGVIITTTATGK